MKKYANIHSATRQISIYFPLPNAEELLPPTPEVIEDSYCTLQMFSLKFDTLILENQSPYVFAL